ncbi:MAG: thioredoxin domain-containing protein [Bdellovibrionota bacterium]
MQGHLQKSSTKFFLVTSFAGFIVALYTLWHHVALNGGAMEQASFCSVNSYINCDAVALSSYSTFLGYPVAGFLVVFYGILLSLGTSLYFASDLDARKLRSSVFVLATAGMIPTLALAAISAFVLKLLCLLCLTSYIINIVLWCFSLKFYRQNPKGEGVHLLPPNSARVPAAVIAVFLLLTPLMMKGMIGASDIEDNVLNTVLYQHFSQTPAGIVTTGVPSFGPEDAKIVVVSYSDFQCPHCARADGVVPQVIRASPGTRYVFKNFPLDPNCNSAMQGSGHPLACLAAKTGYCVYKEKGNDAFFAYEKSVFSQQETLSSALIQKIALEDGASKDTLQTCIDSPETHAAIVAQTEEAKAIGVSATPTIFVNGRKLEYGSVAKVLKAVIARYSETSSNAGK